MSSPSEALPQLRTDIQLVEAQHAGRPIVVVKDGMALSEGPFALHSGIVPLLALFDGAHTIRDLQLTMMRLGGNRLVTEDEARRIIQELDRLLLLRTARYGELLDQAKAAYAALDVRPPSLAGTAYPADEEGLRSLIDGMLDGSGDPDGGGSGSVRGLIAPHIDLSIGAKTYGMAYARLRGVAPRRIVVLGTGHTMGEEIFSLAVKPYATPLGAVPVDVEAITALRATAPRVVAPDDFAHRSEHSIEFQMLFLRRLMPPEIPVVPILCGSVSQWLPKVERFADIPGVGPFLKVLRSTVDGWTLVIAGVDLSHVGPKFGHRASASSLEEEFRRHDGELLCAVGEGSAGALWAEARRVGDGFNVCGLSALATLLEVLPGVRGALIDYRVWHDRATRSAVSFAGVVLRQDGPRLP